MPCTNCSEIRAPLFAPSMAPAGSSMVSRKRRHKGLTVYGVSQRPAAIDKHFFGNASTVRTGRLNYAADVKTMANVLNVTANDVRDLPSLAWIERDMRTGDVSRGKVSFAGGAPVDSARRRA